MILFDTSAWIHYFRHGGIDFERLKVAAVCAPVIQEVLQGIKDPRHFGVVQDGLLALPFLFNPCPLDIYLRAAEILRTGQRKGLTIRSSVDCLVAAMALKANLPVHHFDRDFNAIAKFTGLEIRTKI